MKRFDNNILKKLGLMLLLAFSMFFAGCTIADVREIEIDVHDANVANPRCIKYMHHSLTNEFGGILYGKDPIKITPLPEKKAILVTYDAMSIGRKNIEDTLALNGFDAGEYKADRGVRSTLPSEFFLPEK